MIRRTSKNSDLKDIIRSCPSGVIEDIHEVRYYIYGNEGKYISASLSLEGDVLVAVLPSQDLQRLSNGILYRKAFYSVADESYPDGHLDLEFVDNMNLWLGDINQETPSGEYLTADDLKTINGQSIVGIGDIHIEGGDVDLSDYFTKEETETKIAQHILANNGRIADEYYNREAVDAKMADKADRSEIPGPFKTINGDSIIGEGNIVIQGGEGGGLTPEQEEAVNHIPEIDQQIVELYGLIPGMDQQIVELYGLIPGMDQQIVELSGRVDFAEGEIGTKASIQYVDEKVAEAGGKPSFYIEVNPNKTGVDGVLASKEELEYILDYLLENGKDSANVYLVFNNQVYLVTTVLLSDFTSLVMMDLGAKGPQDKFLNVYCSFGAGGDSKFLNVTELASSSNLKTINGESIIGGGDIEIKGGGSAPVFVVEYTPTVDEFGNAVLEVDDETCWNLKEFLDENNVDECQIYMHSDDWPFNLMTGKYYDANIGYINLYNNELNFVTQITDGVVDMVALGYMYPSVSEAEAELTSSPESVTFQSDGGLKPLIVESEDGSLEYGVYQYNGSTGEVEKLAKTKDVVLKSEIWTGTQAEWDALSDEEKATYMIALVR